jgi:DnaK suppressor protein
VSVRSNKFQKALEAKRDELVLSSSSNRDEIQIENSAEDFERLQQRMNRELAIHNLDRESKLLKRVDEALERIETGTFGICLRCEEAIPEKRLNAVPWAAYCLGCQENVDRLHTTGETEDDGNWLSPAA